MKKIIAGKTYNTETAVVIGHKTCGEFGDPEGYEEKLYRTKKGNFFLFGLGGEESPYTTETIKPLTDSEAKQWQTDNL